MANSPMSQSHSLLKNPISISAFLNVFPDRTRGQKVKPALNDSCHDFEKYTIYVEHFA
jgi:hypothetical protein